MAAGGQDEVLRSFVPFSREMNGTNLSILVLAWLLLMLLALPLVALVFSATRGLWSGGESPSAVVVALGTLILVALSGAVVIGRELYGFRRVRFLSGSLEIDTVMRRVSIPAGALRDVRESRGRLTVMSWADGTADRRVAVAHGFLGLAQGRLVSTVVAWAEAADGGIGTEGPETRDGASGDRDAEFRALASSVTGMNASATAHMAGILGGTLLSWFDPFQPPPRSARPKR